MDYAEAVATVHEPGRVSMHWHLLIIDIGMESRGVEALAVRENQRQDPG